MTRDPIQDDNHEHDAYEPLDLNAVSNDFGHSQQATARVRRFRRRVLFLAILVLATTVGLIAMASHVLTSWSQPLGPVGEDGTATHTVITIPTIAGETDLAEILVSLAEGTGLNASSVANVAWMTDDLDSSDEDPPTDVDEPDRDANVLKALLRAARGTIDIDVKDGEISVTIDRQQLRREQQAVRSEIVEWMKVKFPDQWEQVSLGYGFTMHAKTLDGPTRADAIDLVDLTADLPDAGVVVLIHGLDDPGYVWRELTPYLVDAGYVCAEFNYPNDQGVLDSAELFGAHLRELKASGVSHITIIGHSMGGLVSREVLTGPDYYGGVVEGHDAFPDVRRFIMVGTPNHGSRLAHLRFAAEWRDVMGDVLSGDGVLFGSIFDGAGQAKYDLLPDSDFLTELNQRPMPANLPTTIIAGRASPVTKPKIDLVMSTVRPMLPDEVEDEAADLQDALAELVEGAGDGVVAVESTRLEGVDDFVLVMGNHLSMIRNPLPGMGRKPPSVDLILERLANTPPRHNP